MLKSLYIFAKKGEYEMKIYCELRDCLGWKTGLCSKELLRIYKAKDKFGEYGRCGEFRRRGKTPLTSEDIKPQEEGNFI